MAKRPTIITLHMVTLEAQGETRDTIALLTNCSLPTVGMVLNSPEAKIIRKQLELRILDTHSDVQAEMQTRAPEMIKILTELATDRLVPPQTRQKAAVDYLKFAGHSPVQQVEVRSSRGAQDQDFSDMTDEEIRKKVFNEIDDGEIRRLPPPNIDSFH